MKNVLRGGLKPAKSQSTASTLLLVPFSFHAHTEVIVQ